MTLEEMAKRIETLEAEVRTLKARLPTGGGSTGSWLDLFGKYADDPTFEEATRLGREWREKVNRESLEEMDREERKAQAGKKKPTKAKGKAPKAKPARRGAHGRA